jgi:hypothetical protein
MRSRAKFHAGDHVRIVDLHSPGRVLHGHYDESVKRWYYRVEQENGAIKTWPEYELRRVRRRARDSRRHHHREAGAPTFRQQAIIGRKMRLLERENAGRRKPRSQRQMLAIAYRYAGVPARGTRRRR